MPHRIRAIVVSVLIDKLDASGNVVGELTSDPVKVFPDKFGSIAVEAANLVARLDAEEKAAPKPPAEFSRKKR